MGPSEALVLRAWGHGVHIDPTRVNRKPEEYATELVEILHEARKLDSEREKLSPAGVGPERERGEMLREVAALQTRWESHRGLTEGEHERMRQLQTLLGTREQYDRARRENLSPGRDEKQER